MKKFIIPILFLFPLSTFAQSTPLFVQFVPNPLFNVSDFMPGDNKEANITVGNNTNTLQNAYIEAVNVSNADNLASQMNLEIFEDLTQIYNNNFGTFLNAGPVALSPLETEVFKTYTLKITFLENASNSYQSKTLGFDICIGFSGGNQTCTNTTTVGPEQNPTNNGGGGGSGGGGGGSTSGSQHLIIWNENASNISADGIVPESGEATISWNTNIPATSQVVYGLAVGAPYAFDINNPPSFGYPLVNIEDLTKKVDHAMLLTGLMPGETYVYRVVSRASPPTISYEHQFTVPIPSGNGNIINTTNYSGISQRGEILGSSTANDANSSEVDGEVAGAFDQNNLASVFMAGWSDLLSWWWLLVLLIILVYIVWKFGIKLPNKNF